jgi:hypothetical protein
MQEKTRKRLLETISATSNAINRSFPKVIYVTVLKSKKLSEKYKWDLLNCIKKSPDISLCALENWSEKVLTPDVVDELITGVLSDSIISYDAIKSLPLDLITFDQFEKLAKKSERSAFEISGGTSNYESRVLAFKIATEKKYSTSRGAFRTIMGSPDDYVRMDFCRSGLFARIAENEKYLTKALEKFPDEILIPR